MYTGKKILGYILMVFCIIEISYIASYIITVTHIIIGTD